MKVLLVTNHLNPGGVASHCITLGRELARRGHRVFLASGPGSWEKRVDQAGIERVPAPLDTSSEANPMLWSAIRSLDRWLEGQPVDIVHDQTRVSQVVAAILRRKRTFARVSTCHGYFKRRLFRRLFPLWGDAVIAVSGAVRSHLLNDWKVSPDRVKLVLHGIDSPRPPSDGARPEARARWQAPRDGILIGGLGRLSPVKGYHVLLRALALLKDDSVPYRLALVGDGPAKESLKRLALSLGVSGKVDFSPPIHETQDFFAAVDIFCAPSLEEGFGLSILEAQAAEKAVLATRVGGIPGIIEDGRTGLLVAPEDPGALADSIRRLAADASLRHSLGEAAREGVLERFPLARMIEGTEAVYREVMR